MSILYSFALTRDQFLMSIIEHLLPLGRDRFFNRDCEKVDGRTS
jgi:hypothetical protein